MGNCSSSRKKASSSGMSKHSTVGAQIEVTREFDPTRPREPFPAESNHDAIRLKLAFDGIETGIKKQIRVATKGIFYSWRKGDLARLKKHVISIRKLFSKEANLPDGLVEYLKLGPILVEILTKYRDTDFEIVVESLLTTSNIVASRESESEDTKYIVNLGVLPVIRELLDHPSSDVTEKAIWCLGNIAGDSVVHRNLVINLEINDHLSRVLLDGAKLAIRRNAAGLLRNMLAGWPKPRLDLVVPLLNIALPCIQRQSSEDDKVLCNLFHAVSNFCEFSSLTAEYPETIDAVIESGITLPMCSVVLRSECPKNLILPVIRTVGNLLRLCKWNQTRAILEFGGFRIVQKYFSPTADKEHVLEACRVLRSLPSKGSGQIQMILDDEELVTFMCGMLLPNSPHCFSSSLAELVCEILTRMFEYGTDDQVYKLLTMPLPIRALLLGTMNADFGIHFSAVFGLSRILSKRCFACCQSLIKSDPIENVQNVLDQHPLERMLRYHLTSDEVDLAVLSVAYGCSPNAKVHGTNITLAKYALHVNLPTGIRLNQLSILTILLGPIYFQQYLPKNGVWLPRDLWMLFSERYLQQTGKYDVWLWSTKRNDMKVELFGNCTHTLRT